MSRVALIHWNAEGIEERAARLERAGYEVSGSTVESAADLRALRQNPPDAFVIDLSRRPSQGRDVGLWLRQRRDTRGVPLLFVTREPEKVTRLRELLPDAVYTQWRGIRGALRRAIERPPAKPIVRGAMDGYAGTPLPKKLGLRNGSVVVLLGAPADFETTLGDLPDGVRVRRSSRGAADVVMLFVRTRADLVRRLLPALRRVADGGRLWVAWRKQSSKKGGDLTQRTVRATGLDSGLVDFKIAALDATWSGLCFTRRRARESGSA